MQRGRKPSQRALLRSDTCSESVETAAVVVRIGTILAGMGLRKHERGA